MDKVYKRINWDTTCCNGFIEPDRYLHTQISRAICQAAYKKPLTIEEISISTGIPAMYIEDELPRLEYGDAVCKIGTLKRNRLNLKNGPFPPRKDGGYGWFIVEETVDESENCAEYNAGCNVAGDDTENKNNFLSHIYYYWIFKYYDNSIYHNRGTQWMCANGIPQNSNYGIVKRNLLSDEDAAYLIKNNLILKSDDDYKLNFACFTEKQFKEFIALFDIDDEHLDDLLAEWIITVRKNFVKFVPARLDSQINQWVSGYLFQIIGHIIDELICRGALRKPDSEKPLTDGVFYIEGKYIDP